MNVPRWHQLECILTQIPGSDIQVMLPSDFAAFNSAFLKTISSFAFFNSAFHNFSGHVFAFFNFVFFSFAIFSSIKLWKYKNLMKTCIAFLASNSRPYKVVKKSSLDLLILFLKGICWGVMWTCKFPHVAFR